MKYHQLIESPQRFDEPDPISEPTDHSSIRSQFERWAHKLETYRRVNRISGRLIGGVPCSVYTILGDMWHVPQSDPDLNRRFAQWKSMFDSYTHESLIRTDAKSACMHAIRNRKRWPEAEPYIMKDPSSAVNYAMHVLQYIRWPEAEPYIMKDPWPACDYAIKIMHQAWPEAEPYIYKNIMARLAYDEYVSTLTNRD